MTTATLKLTPISTTQADVQVTIGDWGNATGYGVAWNNQGWDAPFKNIYTSSTSGQVFHHKNLTSGTFQYYRVYRIINGVQYPDYISEGLVYLPKTSNTLIGVYPSTTTHISIMMTAPGGQLQLYRDGSLITTYDKPNGDFYLDTGLTPGTKYTYEAREINNGVWSYQDIKTATTYKQPSTPTITATLASENSVLVQGSVSSFGIPNSGTLYVMARKDGGEWQRVGDTTTAKTISRLHENLDDGSSYTYTIGANNGLTKVTFSKYVTVSIEENGRIRVRVGNEWKKGVPYVRQGGVWKKGKMYVRSGGTWQKGK